MKIDTITNTNFKQRRFPKNGKVVTAIKNEINSAGHGQINSINTAFYQTNGSGINVLGRLIDYILEKKEITAGEESLLKKVINNVLIDIKHPKNLLGRGFHEDVYRINDKYAVKLPDDSYLRINDPNVHVKVLENEFGDLEVYKGNTILEVGDFKVLNNLGNHIEAGIPRKYTGVDKVQYYRSKYLPLFSKVPQESFDKLASDCAKLNSRCREDGNFYYYSFDMVNPNNIVLKDNKLYWVDKIRSGVKEECSTIGLLNTLLNKYGVSTSDWIYDGFGDKTKYARIIFKKIVLAGMRADLPFGDNSYINKKIIENILNNLEINNHNAFISEIGRIDLIQDRDLKLSKTQKLLNDCID